jgi:hypothetical protein
MCFHGGVADGKRTVYGELASVPETMAQADSDRGSTQYRLGEVGEGHEGWHCYWATEAG